MSFQFNELYAQAKKLATPFIASKKAVSGNVGCVLSTPDGKVYKGVSVNTPCSLGFCGEHAAVAALMADRKAVIHSIISVDDDGEVMPPCGRCRQLLLFLHENNQNTKIYINNNGDFVTLSELMPYSKGA
ncbi:cytidine deaminase [Shewanella sp. LC6]|uniref:cytidine deaminase family protein n=1 Tax=Gammaproteobacteria TaxID=1236 RepID=UPI001127FCB3|nr:MULTISPECIES: cytidine deaminase [Gammaproteobacteria]MCG3759059.1 cytidine deaminase [Vibrio cincinnatiensis]QQK61070.1 cytidine deaminase [Shewanella sp. LC6]TPE50843.1 cytidine deaminase [Shewanella sp. LC2]